MIRPKPEHLTPNNRNLSSPRQRNRVRSPSFMPPHARRMLSPHVSPSVTTPVRYINVRVAVPANFDERSTGSLVLTAASSPSAASRRSINESENRSLSLSSPFAFKPIGDDELLETQYASSNSSASSSRIVSPIPSQGAWSPTNFELLDGAYNSPSTQPWGNSTNQSYKTPFRNFESPSQYTAETCSTRSEASVIPKQSVHRESRPFSVLPVLTHRETHKRNTKSQPPRPNSAPTVSRVSTALDDTQRRSRLKTELCMHYMNQRQCPFGSNCTYAHGEKELQMTKLADLHDAGLVDMTTYRIKPCLTWIATGSCPFGKRCTGVHDNRVVSPNASSWLPHTETQGNTIATDINVDALHQKRLHTILYNNPFGSNFNLKARDGCPAGTFKDLYNTICDNRAFTSDWIGRNAGGKRRPVHTIYKLQIALKLRGTTSEWQYKYRPQHMVDTELCMVLQKRAFEVKDGLIGSRRHLKASSATATSCVNEIPLDRYNRKLSHHILVHEIAFGPDCDPSVQGVALWFNIDESMVTVCTPQQAKRFRWKTTVKKPSAKCGNEAKLRNGKAKVTIFDTQATDSFTMIRPHEQLSFSLATDILRHHLCTLKQEGTSCMKDRTEHLQKLEVQRKILEKRFAIQRRDWINWSWPVNVGREVVCTNTLVPSIEGPYLIEDVLENSTAKGAATEGAFVRNIWSSFIETIRIENNKSKIRQKSQQFALKPTAQEFYMDSSLMRKPCFSSANSSKTSGILPFSNRLTVFKLLSQGKHIGECPKVPHIKHSAKLSSHRVKMAGDSRNDYQERCWKSLLCANLSHREKDEWVLVEEHFSQSRSKKVLDIIQQ